MEPAVHLEALQCLGRLVDCMLAPSPAHAPAPSGNSILRLFGAWLFHAADPATGPAYSRSRAVAVGALCRIIRTPQRGAGPFLRASLMRFYHVVIEALQQPEEAPLVLLHSRLLLAQELEGSLSVVLPLLGALRRVLGSPPTYVCVLCPLRTHSNTHTQPHIYTPSDLTAPFGATSKCIPIPHPQPRITFNLVDPQHASPTSSPPFTAPHHLNWPPAAQGVVAAAAAGSHTPPDDAGLLPQPFRDSPAAGRCLAPRGRSALRLCQAPPV